MRARLPILLATSVLALGLNGCASAPAEGDAALKADLWSGPDTPAAVYMLAPGDKIEVIVHTAPELSRELIVAPDGRVRMPLAEPVMAMARTPDELAADLRTALAGELLDPDLDIVATEFASQKVFVGGEVREPGMFDLPGEIDPLQAILMAGGMTRDASSQDVILIRRLPGGKVSSALINVRAGLNDPSLATWGPLRRFDVVYVPRTRISQQNQFVEQFIRNGLPVQFSIFYDVGGGNR